MLLPLLFQHKLFFLNYYKEFIFYYFARIFPDPSISLQWILYFIYIDLLAGDLWANGSHHKGNPGSTVYGWTSAQSLRSTGECFDGTTSHRLCSLHARGQSDDLGNWHHQWYRGNSLNGIFFIFVENIKILFIFIIYLLFIYKHFVKSFFIYFHLIS